MIDFKARVVECCERLYGQAGEPDEAIEAEIESALRSAVADALEEAAKHIEQERPTAVGSGPTSPLVAKARSRDAAKWATITRQANRVRELAREARNG